MYGFAANLLQVEILSQSLTINQSTRTPGDPLESTHFVLAVSGTTSHGNDDVPIDIRFLHNDWGNPPKAPMIGFQNSSTLGLGFLVDQYISFDHLNLIQRNIVDGTIKSAEIEYVGESFPKKPKNDFEQRTIVQIIMP
jgi:hypothetical protein